MKNIIWLITISFLFGCEQHDEIHVEKILGEYYHIKGEEHRSNLELRDDYTYYFNHAYHHSCELWGHYYGKWEIINKTIVLYEGTGMDSLISLKRKENIKSDSVKIIFEDKLLEAFPKLRVRLDWDKEDQQIINQQITFSKDSLFFRHDFRKAFKKDEERDAEYEYHQDGLILTADNFYEIVYFGFDLERMKIGIENFKTNQFPPKILLEYKLKDGILISKGLTNRIYEHKIIQRDELAYFKNK